MGRWLWVKSWVCTDTTTKVEGSVTLGSGWSEGCDGCQNEGEGSGKGEVGVDLMGRSGRRYSRGEKSRFAEY